MGPRYVFPDFSISSSVFRRLPAVSCDENESRLENADSFNFVET